MKKIIIFVLLALLTSISVAKDREYWISAEEVLWDYAPSFPINKMTNKPFNKE